MPERLKSLAVRDAQSVGEALAQDMTDMFKMPDSKRVLRPMQAVTIAETVKYGSVVALGVGQGKTDISFILPTAMESERPLLIVPAKLLDKTIYEFSILEHLWQKPKGLKIISYEHISVNAGFLDSVNPDLIIADEAHKLRNLDAGVTRRVMKFIIDNKIRFVPMSASLTKRSLMDWWHLQLLSMDSDYAPLPCNKAKAEQWAGALDVKVQFRQPLRDLSAFGGDIHEARENFGKTLKRCRGFISATDSEIDAELFIQLDVIEETQIEKTIKEMQKTWELPNGLEFVEALEMHRHTIEMSQGFYYQWREQPPQKWLSVRKAFGKWLRGMRTYYATPTEVIEAHPDNEKYLAWLEIKPIFTPETEAVWFSGEVVDYVKKFLKKNREPCLIWVRHRAMGERLERELNIPFYSDNGENKAGKVIYKAEGEHAILSVFALSEGYNLQAWHNNLVLAPLPDGSRWEQMLGRTHRAGQQKDVNVTVAIMAAINMSEFKQAYSDSKYIKSILGQKQKLSDYSDINGGQINGIF